MKYAAKILAMLAIMVIFSGSIEAADVQSDSEKIFMARKHITPSRMRRPFLPPIPPNRTPQKDYFPRQPLRPKPHYLPHVPKPTYDNRGGRGKRFVPQAPRR